MSSRGRIMQGLCARQFLHWPIFTKHKLTNKMLPLPYGTCFVCGIVTNIYCKDITILQAKHTGTNILTYLEKFVGYDLTDNINRINSNDLCCQNCIIKIDEYDELYKNALILEEDLRRTLIKTLEQQNELDVDEDCEGCEVTSSNDEEIVKHDQIVTPKSSSMFCSICLRDFDSFTELTNHQHIPEKNVTKKIEEHIDKNEIVAAKGTFINYNTNTMIHQQSQTASAKRASIKCSLCGQTFFKKSAIKEHYKECHNDDESRCNFCGGLYGDEEKLKEHRARHINSTNPLECVDCGKVFKAKTPLYRHMATHTLEKFFVCELCGKQFTHNSSFKMHMMAHDDIREKKCDTCGQLFRSTSHLNRHKRVHSGAKPFECLICHRSFAQRYNMMSHYKAHSKESRTGATRKSHVCSVCNATFSSRTKLNDHCEADHSEVASNVES